MIRRVREDLRRAADGVPHHIVALTALFSVLLAMLVAFVFMSGGVTATVLALVIAFVGIPVLVMNLVRRSKRLRDHEHPSR